MQRGLNAMRMKSVHEGRAEGASIWRRLPMKWMSVMSIQGSESELPC